MTSTSPPPTWQRRHSPAEAEADGMAADAAAAAVGPEAGTLAMEAMEATAMAAEVPWASIGTFLLIFRGDYEWRACARGRMAKFRRFAEAKERENTIATPKPETSEGRGEARRGVDEEMIRRCDSLALASRQAQAGNMLCTIIFSTSHWSPLRVPSNDEQTSAGAPRRVRPRRGRRVARWWRRRRARPRRQRQQRWEKRAATGTAPSATAPRPSSRPPSASASASESARASASSSGSSASSEGRSVQESLGRRQQGPFPQQKPRQRSRRRRGQAKQTAAAETESQPQSVVLPREEEQEPEPESPV